VLVYLSDDWLEAIQEAADRDEPLRAAWRDASLSVEQHVTGGPHGEVVFHVVFGDGSVRFGAGPLDDPDVTITEPYEVAVAVAQGQASAQAAAMVGQVSVTGRIDRLQQQAATFDRLADVFGSVRADTSY